MEKNKVRYIWSLLRIGMGWIFFWTFIDKLFGLGFSTLPDKSWIAGGSPTFGFLNFASKGPFVEFYQGLAGNPIADWLFMIGLLLIGLALMLGIGIKIAGYAGAAMMILMYSAGFLPPANNPFLDNHFIYALLMIGFTMSKSGHYLGFGKWWSRTKIVEKYQILE